MVDGLCGEIHGESAVIRTMLVTSMAPSIISHPANPLLARERMFGAIVESMLLLVLGFCILGVLLEPYSRVEICIKQVNYQTHNGHEDSENNDCSLNSRVVTEVDAVHQVSP